MHPKASFHLPLSHNKPAYLEPIEQKENLSY